MLIPIDLDITQGEDRITDRIVWNTDDKELTPDFFAKTYIEENNIDETFHLLISSRIKHRVQESMNNVIRPFLRLRDQLEKKKKLDCIPVLIGLEVTLGGKIFRDRVIWDLHGLDKDVYKYVFGIIKDLNLERSSGPIIQFELLKLILSHMAKVARGGVENIERTTFYSDVCVRSVGSSYDFFPRVEDKWEDNVMSDE